MKQTKQATIVEAEDILGGTPVFRGTRVPASTLFDYIIKGHSLKSFLDDFPSVSADQAKQALTKWKLDMLSMHRENIAQGRGETKTAAEAEAIFAEIAALDTGQIEPLTSGADSREEIYGDRGL